MNYYKYMFFLILILFLGVACGSLNTSSSGVYKNILPPDYSIITLKNNKTFEFFVHQDIQGDLKVKGAWSKEKDTINLNYDSIPSKINKGFMSVYYFEEENLDSCFVQFLYENKPLIGSVVFINGEEMFVNNFEGKVFFKPKYIKNISVKELDGNLLTLRLERFINVNSKFFVKFSQRRDLLYEMLPDKLILEKKDLLFYKKGRIDKRSPFIKHKRQ